MWDLIVLVPDHCLSFYLLSRGLLETSYVDFLYPYEDHKQVFSVSTDLIRGNWEEKITSTTKSRRSLGHCGKLLSVVRPRLGHFAPPALVTPRFQISTQYRPSLA